MPVARRFLISGHVQGVGFRWYAKDAAEREGATGWVRNLPDGRVEVWVEADATAMARVERALRAGPQRAHVERVVTMDGEPPSGSYRAFSIT